VTGVGVGCLVPPWPLAAVRPVEMPQAQSFDAQVTPTNSSGATSGYAYGLASRRPSTPVGIEVTDCVAYQ